MCIQNQCFDKKYLKIPKTFLLKFSFFLQPKNLCILHGQVFGILKKFIFPVISLNVCFMLYLYKFKAAINTYKKFLPNLKSCNNKLKALIRHFSISNPRFFNLLVTNGLAHHYHLGQSTFIFRGFGCDFKVYSIIQ